MNTSPDTIIFSTVAERLRDTTAVRAVGEVGMTAAGFLHPPKERLYRTARELLLNDAPRPVESILSTIEAIEDILVDAHTEEAPLLDTKQLTRFVNTMVQFSDRSGTAHPMLTPSENISALRDDILQFAGQGTIGYANQLEIALQHTPNVPSALWNLMLTTRQYARWRDTGAIDGFEDPNKEEALEQMLEWERIMPPIKPARTSGYQDAAGDAYYVWTHALAKVIYTALPEKSGAISAAYATAFEYGSYAMTASSLLGRISVLGTMSNHIEASRYGNAIGTLAAEKVRSSRRYHE